jgi:nucleotide-binding universal stress UspA family protein
MASTMPANTVYLAAIDGTACADRALEVASTLGAALGNQAELHIVHVLPIGPPLSVMGAAPLMSPNDLLVAGRALLDRACAAAAVHFKGKISGHLGAGEPWREIVQTAATLGADLVVVGTEGRTGIARMALGSVAESVVRHAGCPVLVVRPKDYHAAAEPGIEPPCPDCVATQNKTERAQLWCERHAAHHPQGRLHYELPPTFAVGSMNFRP